MINIPKPKKIEEPKVTETKEVERPKTITEEEAQLETIKEHEKQFFDEDDEILEINWD